MPQNEFTKDAFGQNFYLFLTEVGAGNFGVTIGLGTPKRDFTLLFDTGSSTSWIRCQTCVSDCNDPLPVFNPSKSQTFLKATKCRGNDDCGFHISYNDGSSSAGYYIFDTLSFTPNDQLSGFVFGCAQNVSGDFSGTSGVFGTIGGDISVMIQTVFNFLGLFCYCLPARDQDSRGFLVFGGPASAVCRVDRMLSLTVKPNEDGSGQYLVKLIGITRGQKRLDISSIMGSSLNVMIDSGTIITRLSPPVYAALKFEFNKIMSGFPVAEPGDVYDTCYNLDGVQNWTPPEMVMHFENSVDVKLDPSGVTMKISDSQVCLAFVGNRDANNSNIIDNQQLREQNVLLDLEARKLGFSAARPGCTK